MTTSPTINLSIVVPIYNEEENIANCYRELVANLDKLSLSYELVMVDDGSVDGSWREIAALAAVDPRVKALCFRRNFGQTAAMAAGFDVAEGELIAPIDADLQNDPADIPRLLARLNEGFDVVSGWRRDRKDKLLLRKIPSRIANGLISLLTGVHLHDYGCTLKVYRREVLSRLSLYGEMHRFVPALASMVGARITELPVNHRPRRAGVSKYGINRTMRVILDLITVKFLLKYSTRPMQLFGKWAATAFACGGLSGAATLYMKLSEGLSMNRNPLLILTSFLLFSGIHFIAIGLLAELVTRTWHETQSKPIYALRESLNISASDSLRSDSTVSNNSRD